MNKEHWNTEHFEYIDFEQDSDFFNSNQEKSFRKNKSNAARRKIELLQDQKELNNEIMDYFADY